MSIRELIVGDRENKANEDMIKEILKTVFNSLMRIEREIFMEKKEDKENKCNGYYRRMAKGITKYFKIKGECFVFCVNGILPKYILQNFISNIQ